MYGGEYSSYELKQRMREAEENGRRVADEMRQRALLSSRGSRGPGDFFSSLPMDSVERKRLLDISKLREGYCLQDLQVAILKTSDWGIKAIQEELMTVEQVKCLAVETLKVLLTSELGYNALKDGSITFDQAKSMSVDKISALLTESFTQKSLRFFAEPPVRAAGVMNKEEPTHQHIEEQMTSQQHENRENAAKKIQFWFKRTRDENKVLSMISDKETSLLVNSKVA